MILDFFISIYFVMFWFIGLFWVAGIGWTFNIEKKILFGKYFLFIPRLIFFALLFFNIFFGILHLLNNTPAKLMDYQVGDGICDYSGKVAMTGLYKVNVGTRYIGGRFAGTVYSYNLCPLKEHCSGKLLSEYSDSKKLIGFLDHQRISTGGFAKLFSILFSTLSLILAFNIPKFKSSHKQDIETNKNLVPKQ